MDHQHPSAHAARPVTLDRIERAARLADHSPIVSPYRLVFAHATLADSIVEQPVEDDETGATPSPAYTLATTHRGALSFDDLHSIGEFVNDWNHNCLTPTLVLDYDSPSDVRVTGTTRIDSQWGMTDEQLVVAIDQALGNAGVFVHDLAERFPTVTISAPVSPLAGGDLDIASEAPEDQAYAVDSGRIAEALAGLGIDKLQHSDDEGIYAWINDVLFAFVLDNGPSLIIKGHWDPDLEGRDFLRVFLICNDFNRLSDAPVAYCHSNVDGLQVRLDVAEPIAAGLTDRQLRSLLARSLKAVLHGIDRIAHDVSGESPVAWP